jgi:hypothetical protein
MLLTFEVRPAFRRCTKGATEKEEVEDISEKKGGGLKGCGGVL